MRFIDFLKEAFALLIKEPKLFLPKFFIAFFYSILLLATSYLFVTNSDILILMAQQRVLTPEQMDRALFMAAAMLIIFIITTIAFILDIIVNAMYPLLVSDFYRRKKLSLSSAFHKSLHSAARIVPAGFGLFLLVSIPLSIAISHISISGADFMHKSLFGFILFTFSAFFLAMALYFLYPSIMLEKDSVLKCIKYNFVLVRKNMGVVASATIIPLIATIISLGFAIISVFEPWFLIVFFIYRLLSTCLFTYHMVLNPTIYLKVRAK
jgi:hypothetical protein